MDTIEPVVSDMPLQSAYPSPELTKHLRGFSGCAIRKRVPPAFPRSGLIRSGPSRNSFHRPGEKREWDGERSEEQSHQGPEATIGRPGSRDQVAHDHGQERKEDQYGEHAVNQPSAAGVPMRSSARAEMLALITVRDSGQYSVNCN